MKEYTVCPLCSSLKNLETAAQKFGSDYPDTFLPPQAEQLKVIFDFKPSSSRAKILKQCPFCSTYYLYETDYEFLINGTEDEQTLTRLTHSEALTYLNKAHPQP